MDATGPGCLIDELNALALRSEPEVCAALAALGRAELATLLAYLPRECTCQFVCPDHPDEDCRCPCPCIEAARQRTWPKIHPIIVAFLLKCCDPKAYAEPPPPATESCNTNRDVQIAVMAERHARGQGLWHPLDWLRHPEQVDPRLARKTVRLRNGADVVGELELEGADAH